MSKPEPTDLVFYLPKSLRRNLSEAWLEIEELWRNAPCKNPKLRADRSKAGTIRLLQRCVKLAGNDYVRRPQQFNSVFALQTYGGSITMGPMLRAITQVLAEHGVISMVKTGRVTIVSVADADDPLVPTVVLNNGRSITKAVDRRKSAANKTMHSRDYDAWIRVDPSIEYDNDTKRIQRDLADRTYMNIAAAEENGKLWHLNSRVTRSNNRYHSFWTSLSKPARDCAYDIRTGERVAGIDAVNAQPALIGYWISEYIRFQWSANWYSGPERDIIKDPAWKAEFKSFRESCYRGIYDSLADESGLERFQVKRQLLWLMFRNPRFEPRDPIRAQVLDAFRRRWPLVNTVIEINNRRMARKYGGDCLSWHGRSLESKLMNQVVSQLRKAWREDNSLGWFIVHDCLFVTRQHRRLALKLARKVGKRYGVQFIPNR